MEWKDYQNAVADNSDHWSIKRYRSIALNVLRYLPDVRGKCVDIGCGEGIVTCALKNHRPDLTVYGTDISAVRLTRAAANVRDTTFVAGDLASLPWRNGSFDAVVCCEVLEHLPDNMPAVKELFRILKTGGILLVTVPDRQKISWEICRKCGSRVYKDGHLHSFSPEDLRGMLSPWGEIVTLTPVGKKWRQVRRKITALVSGREYKGKFLLCVAKKR